MLSHVPGLRISSQLTRTISKGVISGAHFGQVVVRAACTFSQSILFRVGISWSSKSSRSCRRRLAQGAIAIDFHRAGRSPSSVSFTASYDFGKTMRLCGLGSVYGDPGASPYIVGVTVNTCNFRFTGLSA